MRTLVALALAVLAVVLPLLAHAGAGPEGADQDRHDRVARRAALAANGKDMVNGYELFLEEQKHRLAGPRGEVHRRGRRGQAGHRASPRCAALVEGQGVHLVIGPAQRGRRLRDRRPTSTARRSPPSFPIVAGDDLTQRKRSPYIVRVGWASSQPSHPFGKWVHDDLKYKKIAIIAYDFAFGWEVRGRLPAHVRGGGRADRAEAVAAARQRRTSRRTSRSSAATWTPSSRSSPAPTPLRFAKQYAEAGLKGKVPLIGGGTFTDEHVLRTMGDEVLGVVTVAALLGGARRRRRTASSPRPTRRSTSRCRRTTRRAPTWRASR